MQFIVNKTTTRTIAVEAPTTEEATAQARTEQGVLMGYSESFNVQLRLQPPQVPQVPVQPPNVIAR